MTTPVALERLRTEVGELLASHASARNVADFAAYADDPAGFLRDVLRCQPWAKQVEMAERVRDHSRTVVVTANGLGKDWMTARLALWWIFARRGFVVLTGPTERQVKQILMRELRRAFAQAPELPGELFALELRVADDCGLIAFTSDNADRLTGFHHPRLLICMTEGQGVDDEAYEAALACATSPENRLFVYGNPTRPTGAFYRAAQNESWSVLTIRADEHPNVVSGRQEIPGAVSREWIQMMREEYGESSSIYAARVLAKFPEDAIEGLVRRAWLRAAFERHERGTLADAAMQQRLVLAVDVARFGTDATVVAFVRGPVVEKLVSWYGASITDTADRIIDMADAATVQNPPPKFPHMGAPPKIVVDEPGLGGGLIDVLRQRGRPVIAFNGAERPKDAGRFLNARAETHWRIRELLERGEVALPQDDNLEEEALAVQWQLTLGGGKVQILSKDLIRAELGRSPDRLDAVVMGLAVSVGNLEHRAIVHAVDL